MRGWIVGLIVLLGVAAGAGAQQAQTPDGVLAEFRRQLLRALKNQTNAKEAREAAVSAAKSMFEKEISAAKPARPETLEQAYSALLKNLSDSRPFVGEAYLAERGQWVSAAVKVFEVEIKFAPDAGETRTTQQCFDLLVGRITRASKQFGEDLMLRTQAEQGAKKIFEEMVGKSSNSASVDSLSEFSRQMARVDQIFPQNTEAQRKYNGPSNALLKEAAKRCLDRAKESTSK